MINELRQIAIFASTIDHGSFKKAAEDLNLAPSVVSHHISQLEDKLGVALIYRSTRKLSLTKEGERLLQSAHVMQEAVTTALDELRGQSSEPSGTLRITVTSGLSQSGVITSIAEFCSKYPKIQVHTEFSDQPSHLINDGYDLAIRVGTNSDRTHNRRTLFKGKRCLVGAASYLSNHRRIRIPDDLNKCKWVVLASTRGAKTRLSKKGKRSVEIVPTGQISADNSLAVYSFVKAGAGIAIVPHFLTINDVKHGDVQYLLPSWEIDALDIFAEWPKDAPREGIVRLLVSELCDSAHSLT